MAYLDETGLAALWDDVVKLAGGMSKAAAFESWDEMAKLASSGHLPSLLPIASKVTTKWADTSPGVATVHDVAWNVAHYQQGTLSDGKTGRVAVLQMDKCLPFETQFSPYQAFLTAVTVIPAGTYNVVMGFSWGKNVVKDKVYQFTLAHDLPAGGQLAGFRGAPDQAPTSWKVYAYASSSAATETEVCTVTEGNDGTNLGTFTAAGEALVPASGTPGNVKTVGSLQFYGLNSLHRVAYGNNRWLHSPLRQYLNAEGTNWWRAATVFDRPPAYVGHTGFLANLPADMVEAMQPIAQTTALNYVTDGGTSAEPQYDTTYDKVFLPSGKQHHVEANANYGGVAGLEGETWEYWTRVHGSQTPAKWGQTYPEYCQYDLAAPTTARTCWLRSAYRGNGHGVTCVGASGLCGGYNAVGGYRAAAACAIGQIG